MSENRSILDVACGSRMFYFDRSDERVVFMDNREESHSLRDKSSRGGQRFLEVKPDVIGDFTAMEFPDESFSLVVFMDNGEESHSLRDKSSRGGQRFLEVKPDVIGDFTAMEFPDESFSLVVF